MKSFLAQRRKGAKAQSFKNQKSQYFKKWYMGALAASLTIATIEGRRDALKVFLLWSIDRDLTHPAAITKPKGHKDLTPKE